MANATRRTLLRNGCAAVGAAILSLELPDAARAQAESGEVFHVFAFQWKPATSDAEKERARKEIAAFQTVIPGLLQTHVGPNISPRGKGYTFGGIMQFKDQASLEAYFQHPAHQALLKWLVPLIDAVELDLRAQPVGADALVRPASAASVQDHPRPYSDYLRYWTPLAHQLLSTAISNSFSFVI